MKYIVNTAKVLFLGMILSSLFMACNEDESVKYQMSGGVPEVYYVRLSDPALADSLIVGAYMEQPICLIGKNLNSIQEIYFNDQKATLNLNYITDKALLVTVPKNIPVDVTNKMYMITGDKRTVEYDFKVLVPAPVLVSMKCEHALPGQVDAIYGDYLLDDPNVPIQVIFPGNIEAEVVSSNRNEVKYIVPNGTYEGPVTVTTQYGTTRSTFNYLESRGWITGFEASENNGAGYMPGWGRPSRIEEDPDLALKGRYVYMSGSIGSDESGWVSGGDGFTINIWSRDNPDNPNSDIANPMFSSNPETSILKFEVNVLSTWSAAPLIVAFSAANDLENWKWADTTQPRGFWVPWATAEGNSYVSDGWVTVSIPIADCKYNGSGEDVKMPTAFGQLGIAVHNRGMAAYAGTPCNPIILLDNVRVVPGE